MCEFKGRSRSPGPRLDPNEKKNGLSDEVVAGEAVREGWKCSEGENNGLY